MMRKILALGLILPYVCFLVFLGNEVFSSSKDYGSVVVQVVSIYDGDTFTVNILNYPPIIGKKISVRIAKINSPELKDPNLFVRQEARQAKEFTTNALKKACKVELREMQRDKYFRILAKVYVDGKNLGDLLIENGLAKLYSGGKD